MRLIGLDVGTKRIGIAKADTSTRIAVPDGFVNVNGQEFSEIARIARLYDCNSFVIGLPRNNQGEETAQTAYVRKFAHALAQTIPGTKIYFQDESLTSVEAESRLKSRKKGFEKGDVDAEAAAIILQDCIEHFSGRVKQSSNSDPKSDIGDIWSGAKQLANTTAKKAKSTSSKAGKIIATVSIALILVLGCGFLLANHWYQDQLRPVALNVDCGQSAEDTGTKSEDCSFVTFTVSPDDSITTIAQNLENEKLIRSALAFRLYARLNGISSSLKAGQYNFRKTLSVSEIADLLVKGDSSSEVFSFTILPGSTISDIKASLAKIGYSTTEIDTAFSKDYSSVSAELKELLSTKPAETSLEGYIYGDTYEFFKGESVENILITAMKELSTVVKNNNLISAFEAQGLTLHEGITLASIVQKEATPEDQPGVARVFFNRLHQGIMLGSDITAQYAANLIDPERTQLTDNASVIDVDSPYNTRKYAGLPPGPVCNPGVSALLAVAKPADSDYLYFLTGDDGVIYYSYTEEEHLQNVSAHCQELCNTQL